MDVIVCVPWIQTNCPWRERSREWTHAYYSRLGIPVVYGLDDSRPINRSRARNNSAAMVEADVFFFADADMWVPEEQFKASIADAAHTGRMILAYTTHTRLSKQATRTVLDGGMSHEGQTVKMTPSGAFAITRDLYEQVGGHDERFSGWGYEDRSFQFACETIAGPGKRITGPSWHMWHPRGADQSTVTPERKRGRELALRYKRAAGVIPRTGIIAATRDAKPDREAMLAILKEPGGPLSVRESSRV